MTLRSIQSPDVSFLLLFIFIVCTLYLRRGLCRGKSPCFGIHSYQPSAETPQKLFMAGIWKALLCVSRWCIVVPAPSGLGRLRWYTRRTEPGEPWVEVESGMQGMCINVLAINREYWRYVSWDATKQECESKRVSC